MYTSIMERDHARLEINESTDGQRPVCAFLISNEIR